MTPLCEKYVQIINEYRAGKYGKWLTLGGIFRLAGEPNLLNDLNESELTYLNESGKMSNMVFSSALKALKEREKATAFITVLAVNYEKLMPSACQQQTVYNNIQNSIADAV